MMSELKHENLERQKVGLCASCVHMSRLTSERGSMFYRCGLSDTDPRFPKYPRLPVLQCPGYERLELAKR